tara:strand:+ start:754 stop:1167 length:414 start_codon:yes stop_codon:yes gene_type:complete
MYRARGLKALINVMSEEEASNIENKINNISEMQDDYLLIVQETINKVRDGKKCDEVMGDLCSNKYLHGDEYFEGIKKKVEEHDLFLVKPFEVEEGVLECGKCGSNKTLSYTKQTRSGDESTTVFAVCYDCHNKWMMS